MYLCSLGGVQRLKRTWCSAAHPLQAPRPARARPRLRAIHRAHIRTVEPIGARSPRQCIFAAVPMHFVSTADACPTAQLTVVLGPFTQLDAFYTHIVVPACASSPGRYLLPRARCKLPSADLRWAWSALRSSVYARDTRRDALHACVPHQPSARSYSGIADLLIRRMGFPPVGAHAFTRLTRCFHTKHNASQGKTPRVEGRVAA